MDNTFFAYVRSFSFHLTDILNQEHFLFLVRSLDEMLRATCIILLRKNLDKATNV